MIAGGQLTPEETHPRAKGSSIVGRQAVTTAEALTGGRAPVRRGAARSGNVSRYARDKPEGTGHETAGRPARRARNTQKDPQARSLNSSRCP
jgi:hypothetical protein